MCTETKLNVERIKEIRKEISQKTIEFVKNPENINKILLLKSHQGTGKTITVLKTLLSRKDIPFVYLTYEHDHLKKTINDEILRKYELFHLKGRGQEENGELLCTNSLYEEIRGYNINIKKFLCNPKRCEDFEICEYLKQFTILDSKFQSWAGVHAHLKIKHTHKYLKKKKKEYPYRCLVIDENPTSNLIKKVSITKNDLKQTTEVLSETIQNIKENKNSTNKQKQSISAYPTILAIINSLQHIITITEKEGVSGLNFIRVFVEKIIEGGDKVEDIKNSIQDESMDVFVKRCQDAVYKRFCSGYDDEYLKDILEDLINIAERCFYYKDKKLEYDINLPFYSEKEEKIEDGKIWNRDYITFNKVKKKLPEVPIIILDATGEKDFYEQVFNREVIEYAPSLEIERNVIQITDGMYYAKSLHRKNTRNNVYNAVRLVILHHQKKGDGTVNVVTLKKFARKSNEKGDYTGMSIERYLEKTKVDMKNVQIWHYGDVKGKNNMQNDKVLILIGTSEPNYYSYPKEIGCWYEGKEKIVADRIIESKGSKYHGHDYRYKDSRYSTWNKQKREHEIEQDIERLRFALSTEEKVVYLFSMLPIDFETNKMSIKQLKLELLEESDRNHIPHVIVLDALFAARGKGSHKLLSEKTRNKKEVKKVGYPNIIKELLERDIIKFSEGRESRHRKTGYVYQFTEGGKEWYKYMRGSLDYYFNKK